MSLRRLVVPLWLLAITGCVTHAPMSEMTMFRDPATPVRHEKYFIGGITATASATSPATDAWMRRDYPHYASQQLASPRASYAGGVYFAASDSAGNFGAALTLGLLLGLDATVRLRGRTYLTAGYSVGDLLHAYLQYRAFNTPLVGGTIGVGARTEYLYFETPCESIMFCGQDRRFYSLGTRAVILLRDRQATSIGYKIVVYVGYVPYVRQPVASLTLALGGI